MLERTMNMWIEWVTTEGIIISDSIVKKKGYQFTQSFAISEELLTFSNSAPLENLSEE
ncbi:4712_t:CDS:2 [Diversispora eburnea]|uniref:4712_t:CDS:1 n=1 Tax=Diversispora eburnea TaxID=1213867 RepID=A0A9N8V2L0_9GLOM|nr:4712_t:CDS:2 [Diversispora eburnea]